MYDIGSVSIAGCFMMLMDNPRHFIFVDGHPVEFSSPEWGLLEWIDWLGSHELRLKLTIIDCVRICTVFTGVNQQKGKDNSLVFETLISLSGKKDEFDLGGIVFQYSTLSQAKKGHALAVDRVREFFPNDSVQERIFNFGQTNI